MDEQEGGGGGIRTTKKTKTGEVEYKEKSGTAWSHSYLNQKPWHPLSYPNQRRKWIAEQTHATRDRRAQEVAREYAQEQEFFRQTAMVSGKEKEKLEIMKAVSFMYVRPPGYSAELAAAANAADAEKSDPIAGDDVAVEVKKKVVRPKDVFGRSVATEEEFGLLKNAPKMDTGVAGRARPFGVEIRNVKCLRCGAHGHQSGDRECPLKDAILGNEEARLRRDDPLTAILEHTDSQALKWELKQKPGISPPRGGFKPDDPNQQIVAEEIFDEYGGFLGDGNIPDFLANFASKPKKKSGSGKKSKHKSQQSSESEQEVSSSSMDGERRSKKSKHEKKSKKNKRRDYSSDVSESYYRESRSKHRHSRRSRSYSSDNSEEERHYRDKRRSDHSHRDSASKGKEEEKHRSYSHRDSESKGKEEEKHRSYSYRDSESKGKEKEKHRSYSRHRERYSYC